MIKINKYQSIKNLIWLYFWLLMFEGALRKWVFPSLQAPLLIVRDPVVILIYAIAISKGIFPKNKFVISLFFIAIITSVPHLLMSLSSGIENTVWVTIYGIRTNFLHQFLIFLIPKVFTIDDVRKIGKWVLILALPIGLLMVYQFKSSPNARINAGAGTAEGAIGQILSVGKVRPAAIFSYITGVASFMSLTAVFIFDGILKRHVYKYWLIVFAAFGLFSGMVVGGSRLLILSVAFVVFIAIISMILKRRYLSNLVKVAILACVTYFIVSSYSFYQEGIETMQARIERSGTLTTGQNPIIDRVAGGFIQPLLGITEIPILGYGLGLGTNAGAAILTKQRTFFIAEGEWGRILGEVGPALGFVYIIWRIALAFSLGLTSFNALNRDNFLPLLLFGASSISLLTGQWAQPTMVGFAVLGAGLCFAAARSDHLIVR